jgi:hypothetical protein
MKNVMCFLVIRKDEDSDENDYIGLFMRIFFYYVPFATVLIFDIYAVIRIQIHFRRIQIGPKDRRDITNLLLYPIVLLISWIWIIIARSIEAINGE